MVCFHLKLCAARESKKQSTTMKLSAFFDDVKARMAARNDPRSVESVPAVRVVGEPRHVLERALDDDAARHGVRIDVPVTIIGDGRETFSERVRWGILSTLGRAMTWPLRLLGRIVERIVDEGVSFAFRIAGYLALLLLAPVMLWIGFDVANEYMGHRDIHGAYAHGVNTLRDLWIRFSSLL